MNQTDTTSFQPLAFDEPDGNLIAFRIDKGKVTAEQAEPLFERIRTAHADGRKLRVFYELHGIPMSQMGVVVEKLKQLGTILRTIERIAIVGDQRWLTVYRAVMDPITKMDIRVFGTDEADTALAWIRE